MSKFGLTPAQRFARSQALSGKAITGPAVALNPGDKITVCKDGTMIIKPASTSGKKPSTEKKAGLSSALVRPP